MVNAGYRITAIKSLLDDRRLNSTMVCARVHDQMVAGDYYSAMAVIKRKWTRPIMNWPQVLNRLVIRFEDRIEF